jgi:hypothetical protein
VKRKILPGILVFLQREKLCRSTILAKYLSFLFLIVFSFLYACTGPDNIDSSQLFTLMDNQAVGVQFENNVSYTESFNVYTYRNFYNGGGVGIGDINNDGLITNSISTREGFPLMILPRVQMWPQKESGQQG